MSALTWTALPQPQQPAPPVGEMKALGGDRFQIGRIVVDKRAGRFTVPGRVHLMERPLEYLATTPGGMKEYESLLEIDTNGTEFNLACILLGLERDPKQGPFQQFNTMTLVGPRVAISVAWSVDGKRREISAAEAVLNPTAGVKPQSVEWVYTGSVPAQPNRPFGADATGTLIGFVHDAYSIIESNVGLGIGAYGSVSGNTALMPPVGTAIELIVEVSRAAK